MATLITMLMMMITLALPVADCGEIVRMHRAYPPAHEEDVHVVLARDQARARRIITNFSVSGSDSVFVAGLYYAKVKLGTPPKEYAVQIDTGSDLLWVNCKSCRGCPPTTFIGVNLSYFDPASSSTATPVGCSRHCQPCSEEHSDLCGYRVDYLDGSGTTGYYVTDKMQLTSIQPKSNSSASSELVQFGFPKGGIGKLQAKYGTACWIILQPVLANGARCSTTRYGQFSNTDFSVDGIFGFGQDRISVLSQLSSQGITPRVFSHCLKGGDVGGGILVIGEVVHPRIVYSPLIPSQPHYNLRLLSISVGGQVLPIDSMATTNGNEGMVVDSGTTLTYLLKNDYTSFVGAINNYVARFARPKQDDRLLCYYKTTSDGIQFPQVTLNFDGDAAMVLRPEDYLLYVPVGDGTTRPCMGFHTALDGGFPILGDLSLKDKIIVYDLQEQRIGWTDYNCSASYKVNTSYGFTSDSHFEFSSRTIYISILAMVIVELFVMIM